MEPDTTSPPTSPPPSQGPDPAVTQSAPDPSTQQYDTIIPPPAPTPDPLDVQTQNEPQVVPEQRPQAFLTPTGGISASSLRLDGGEPATQEEIDRANSDEAKQASIDNSLTPRYYEGQRITFTSGPEQGRMGYVSQIVYSDDVQHMIANAGIPGSRFAEVAYYIIRTRDGRSDTLVATPDQVKALDDIDGWGRGQI